MLSELDRLLAVTRAYLDQRGHPDPDFELSAESAVSQDAQISGIDVDDYVEDLAAEFGPIVYQIPWLRFTDQEGSFRGCGCLLVPFWLLKRIAISFYRGERVFLPPKADNFGPRLEFRHIAAVIEKGQWFDP